MEMSGCLFVVPKALRNDVLFLFHLWHLDSLSSYVFLSGFWCVHLHLLRSGDGYKDGRPGNLRSTLLPRRHVEPTGFLYRHGRVRTSCSLYFIAFLYEGTLMRVNSERFCYRHTSCKAEWFAKNEVHVKAWWVNTVFIKLICRIKWEAHSCLRLSLLLVFLYVETTASI